MVKCPNFHGLDLVCFKINLCGLYHLIIPGSVILLEQPIWNNKLGCQLRIQLGTILFSFLSNAPRFVDVVFLTIIILGN